MGSLIGEAENPQYEDGGPGNLGRSCTLARARVASEGKPTAGTATQCCAVLKHESAKSVHE